MTEIIFETADQDAASRTLQVTVPMERLAEVERRAAREYASRVRLPGFRKGHAPEAMVRRRFASEIRQYVLEDSVRESWRQILDRGELQPTAEPQVSDLHFHDGEPLRFKLLVEVRPHLELATMTGFSATRTVAPVTDEQIEEQLAKLQDQKASWKPAGEGVRPAPGQLVSITVEQLGDDAPGSASPHTLILGEGQTIPDLEEAIAAMTPGETREVQVRFPDDHVDEARRGEVRQLRVTLHEVKVRDLPPLDDAFAREIGDFASVEALRAAIRSDLESDAVRTADSAVRDQIVDRLIEANDVPAPPTLVRRLLGAFAEMYQIDASQGEAFVSAFTPVAERQVRRELVLDAVATARNLHSTEADLDARVAELAAARGTTPGALYAELEKARRLDDLARQITVDKTFAWLLENSTVTENRA